LNPLFINITVFLDDILKNMGK